MCKALWLNGLRSVALFCLAACALTASSDSHCSADIGGSTGNEAVSNKDWPTGAETVFNFQGRIAFWEGPPLGGGQWHAECRGNAKQLSEILAAFDRMDAKNKRIVVHNGVGQSFWLNPSHDPAKVDAAKIDWSFMVWSKPHWERLIGPKKTRDKNDAALEPLSQIDIYTGGSVTWSDVTVPKSLTVVDRRK